MYICAADIYSSYTLRADGQWAVRHCGSAVGSGQLVRLGRWYATLPTSNVASERVFGVVRGLEDDQRRSAGEDTVTIETLARCNSWLVDIVKERHGRL